MSTELKSKSDTFHAAERAISGCRNLKSLYLEKSSAQSCDKHGLKFCAGASPDFAIAVICLRLESYTGYYGNSSCSTLGNVGGSKDFTAALAIWLNANFQTVMDGVADVMAKGLAKSRGAYLAELKAEMERVEATVPVTESPAA